MDPRYYGLFELLFVGAMALGFGVWQLWSVNRAIGRKDETSAPRAGHAVGEHPLDDG